MATSNDKLLFLLTDGIEKLAQFKKQKIKKKQSILRKAEELKEKIENYKRNKSLMDNL